MSSKCNLMWQDQRAFLVFIRVLHIGVQTISMFFKDLFSSHETILGSFPFDCYMSWFKLANFTFHFTLGITFWECWAGSWESTSQFSVAKMFPRVWSKQIYCIHETVFAVYLVSTQCKQQFSLSVLSHKLEAFIQQG